MVPWPTGIYLPSGISEVGVGIGSKCYLGRLEFTCRRGFLRLRVGIGSTCYLGRLEFTCRRDFVALDWLWHQVPLSDLNLFAVRDFAALVAPPTGFDTRFRFRSEFTCRSEVQFCRSSPLDSGRLGRPIS